MGLCGSGMNCYGMGLGSDVFAPPCAKPHAFGYFDSFAAFGCAGRDGGNEVQVCILQGPKGLSL